MAFRGFKERALRVLGRDPVQAAAVRAYTGLVEQARLPVLYEAPPEGFGVPDTVEGRFDLVTLHVFLLLRRLKDAPEKAAGAQDTDAFGRHVFDVMFRDMDDSLREMGVGDMKVGKKVRGLAEEFYGRVGAYDGAMGDEAALAPALARNVYAAPDAPSAPAARDLARYVHEVAGALDRTPITDITAGRLALPRPARTREAA